MVSVILGPKKPLESDEISNMDELFGLFVPILTLPPFKTKVSGAVIELKLRVNELKSTVLFPCSVPSPVYIVGGKFS